MKIRSDILSVYQSIHTWTGVLTALILFIGFFAGSLSLFKPALNQWIAPTQNQFGTTSNGQLDQLVNQTLSQYQGAKRRLIVHVNSGQDNQSPVMWYEDNVGFGLNLDAPQWHAGLDETGQLKVKQSAPSAFGELIDRLHRTAGIPGKVGYQDFGVLVMGVACVAYFLALVSGVILMLPTLSRNLFALRQSSGSRRLLLDSHNLLGLTALPFHLIIALTVIVFAFRGYFYDGLRTVVYEDQPMFPSAVKVEPKQYSTDELISIKQWLAEMEQQVPGYEVTKVVYSSLDSQYPVLQISLLNRKTLMRGPVTDYIFAHPYTGQILNGSIVPGEQGFWGRAVAPFYALHFGSFGDNGVRWLYFVLGLMGAFIFYSGNLLWLDKRRSKFKGDKGQEPISCFILSRLTVGVCLGSISGVAVSMVIGKWLYPLVANINDYYIAIYYGLFFAAIAWAFIQGPRLSTVWLLRFCTIACAAIPLTSIAMLSLGSDVYGLSVNRATNAVDIVALVCAIVFYVLAKKQ